ncbi:MAG: hypothetical protein ACR2N2_05400 [Acidimicrobiia bacterium]
MSAEAIYELIGYIGSALVVISLAMSSIIRLRVLNLAGALVFTAYGFLIGSIPVIITNAIIAVLDVYYLWKEVRTREELTVIRVASDDPFLEAFVNVFGADMTTYLASSSDVSEADVRLVMLRDATAAGVFLGADGGDGTLEVIVDYVAPPFRDLKSGSSLYGDDGARFRGLGYQRLVVPQVHDKQSAYFSKMGFAREGSAAVLDVRRA